VDFFSSRSSAATTDFILARVCDQDLPTAGLYGLNDVRFMFAGNAAVATDHHQAAETYFIFR
jgi:hypothetical protein